MQAVDTNVLIRILIDDATASKQSATARHFAQKHKKLFIPQIVQIETVWVLESCYHLTKTEVIHILQHLLENSAFTLQFETQFQTALTLFSTSSADFSDCLIVATCSTENYTLTTFDKSLGKLKGVSLLK